MGRSTRRRLPGEFDPHDRDEAVADEIGDYLERRSREMEAQGLPPAEARAAAEQAFGDIEGIRAECTKIQQRKIQRDRIREVMGTIIRDIRHGVRALISRPGYAALAILTLALGIGANTAIFSLVNAVLLQPLPFPEPERLVQLWETRPDQASRNVAPANYLDWRARSESYEHLTIWRRMTRNLLDVDQPERLALANTSGNFFAAMGVEASLGRTFSLGTEAPEERTVVLADALWRRTFGADPSVVGQTIRLDRETYRVLGVMPASFTFPGDVDLWVRAPFDVPEIPGFPGDIRELRDAWYTRVVGRLKPGTTMIAAQAEAHAIAEGLSSEHPVTNEDAGIRLVSLHEQIVGTSARTLWLLLGAVGLVLLIACTNVANLLLVRAASRTRELAVRTALGASRQRIVGHVVGESLVLALVGGVLGIGLSYGGLRFLPSQLPGVLPRSGEVGIDGAVLAYSVLVTLITAVVFGAIPSLAASKAQPSEALGDRAHGGGGRRGRTVRSGLVVAEVSLAVVLVLGAGLVVKSLWRAANVDPGFETQGLVTLRLSLPNARSMSIDERLQFYDSVRDRIEAIPGVETAGFAQTGPLRQGSSAGIRVEGRANDPRRPESVLWNVVSRGYFESLAVPVVRGRALAASDTDGSERVAVVNEALVRLTFPDEDPIGRRINTGLDGRTDGEWNYATVVGVVADTRNGGPAEPARASMFRPIRQRSSFGGEAMMLTVRAPGLGDELFAQLRREIWAVNPNVPIYQMARGEALADRYLAGYRFVFLLLGMFAGLAMLLGAVGIYGVTAYGVNQRTQEIGLRIAMGARSREVVWMVARQGLTPSLLGVALGLGLALAAGRVMQTLLFEVTPNDPATFFVVATVVIGIALLANLIPAWKAASVDPVTAMRVD